MQFFVLLVKQEVGESMRIYRGGEGTECTIGKAVMRGCLISDGKTLKETLIKITLWYFCHTYMYMNRMHRNRLSVNLLSLFLLIDNQQVIVVGVGLGGASRKNPGKNLSFSCFFAYWKSRLHTSTLALSDDIKTAGEGFVEFTSGHRLLNSSVHSLPNQAQFNYLINPLLNTCSNKNSPNHL